MIVNPPKFCDLDKAQASLTERFAKFGLTTSDFDFVLTTAEDTTGRKDTVLVTEDRDFVLAACFDRYANPDVPDMLHCHALDHEETGMTGQFQVLRG